MAKLTVTVMFLFFSSSAVAVQIEVLGLFSNAAMLRIDGESLLLKKGERSKEGVMLVDANSREAVIEFEGKVQSLNLSDKIGTSFKTPERAQVHVPMNKNRQYISNWWYINPQHRIPTTFDKDQQELIQAIFDSLHSREHQDAVEDTAV